MAFRKFNVAEGCQRQLYDTLSNKYSGDYMGWEISGDGKASISLSDINNTTVIVNNEKLSSESFNGVACMRIGGTQNNVEALIEELGLNNLAEEEE